MSRRTRSSTRKKAIHMSVKKDAADFLPDHLKKWSDYANYLQHRIIVGRMYWQVKDNGFVSLHRRTLERAIHYSILGPVMDWMIENKVIERDGSRADCTNWKPARRRDGSDGVSIGYRFCAEYAALETCRVACRSVKANNKFQKLKRGPKQMKNFKEEVHRPLQRWLQKVNLDLPSAVKLVQNAGLDPEIAKNVIDLSTYIANGDATELSVCNYGRVHTAITRLLTPIRGCLSIGGQPLVELDVANSQPLFLAIFILKTLDNPRIRTLPDILTTSPKELSRNGTGCDMSDNSSSMTFKVYLPTDMTYTNHNHNKSHLLYVPRKCRELDVTSCNTNEILRIRNFGYVPPDLQLFINLCETGSLYEHLMTRIGWIGDRKIFKKVFFEFLYGPVTDFVVAWAMASEFPSVMAFIEWHKGRHGYKELSREMQRAESKLMIEGVCGSLIAQNIKIPIITIHDSILTWPEFVSTVRATIEAGFSELGINPTVREKKIKPLNANDCGIQIHEITRTEDDLAMTGFEELSRNIDCAKMDPKLQLKFSQLKPRVDRAGKLSRNAAGDAVYNIGKYKGTPVLEEPDFALWMLKHNFSKDTKEILGRILNIAEHPVEAVA